MTITALLKSFGTLKTDGTVQADKPISPNNATSLTAGKGSNPFSGSKQKKRRNLNSKYRLNAIIQKNCRFALILSQSNDHQMKMINKIIILYRSLLEKYNPNQMTLGQKQRLFSRLISELILWAYDNGYEFAKADAYRNPKVFGTMGEKKGYGSPYSNHKLKLAQDLDLFIDDVYQRTTEAHKPIGEKWESMHELCSWGGRFSKKDGNHYSLEHNGRR